jgi:hypothetical protein
LSNDTPFYERNSVLFVAGALLAISLALLQPYITEAFPAARVRAWLAEPVARRAFTLAAGGAIFVLGYALGRRRGPYSDPLFQIGDHLLAVGEAERAQALKEGYSEDGLNDGLACYVSPSPGDGLVPLYRFWQEGRFDHFYTKDARERDAARELGYIDQGPCCYVHDTHVPGTVALYRLWRPELRGGDHLYTTKITEKDNAMRKLGYHDEGTACYVFANPAPNRTPMYRLFRAG